MDSKRILETLSKNGYSITKSRKLVLETLINSSTPLNPYEISDLIKKTNQKVDVVTIYRILKVFEELKIAHFFKGQQKYLLCNKPCQNHCHHQFLCKKCGKVDDLHLDDNSFLKKIVTKYPQIKFDEHYFEFTGECQACVS